MSNGNSDGNVYIQKAIANRVSELLDDIGADYIDSQTALFSVLISVGMMKYESDGIPTNAAMDLSIVDCRVLVKTLEDTLTEITQSGVGYAEIVASMKGPAS